MAEETKYVVEVDCSTGESITRAMTKAELEAHAEMVKETEAQRAKDEAEAKAREEAKASALTKLTALGLSVDEVKAILG